MDYMGASLRLFPSTDKIHLEAHLHLFFSTTKGFQDGAQHRLPCRGTILPLLLAKYVTLKKLASRSELTDTWPDDLQ